MKKHPHRPSLKAIVLIALTVMVCAIIFSGTMKAAQKAPHVEEDQFFDVSKTQLAQTMGGPIKLVSVTQPSRGGFVKIIDQVNLSYTPAHDFVGTEFFDYTIADKQGATATARITITVNDRAPVAKVLVNGQWVASGLFTIRKPRWGRAGVDLSAANSFDPDGDKITAYRWTGDRDDPRDARTTTTWLSKGIYKFQLRVEAPGGTSAPVNFEVRVQ